jgi:decaprenylphospho-beta-D-erythro-pentofuranosid-2-ulose 2-reductase
VTAPVRTVLILGATSDIGRAIALAYAKAGWGLRLAGRDPGGLERERLDLVARYDSTVTTQTVDVLSLDDIRGLADAATVLPDTVISVVGDLGDQARAQSDLDEAIRIMRVNYEGPALVLGQFADAMAQRGSGVLVGVGSVAGERGRVSNYVYGSAKAGLHAFLSGLRQRLAGQGVHVLTVKPGFVRTRMTDGMALPGALTASAEEVGEAVYRAAELRRTDVLYVRWMWRFIMIIIKLIPERIFKRLNIR